MDDLGYMLPRTWSGRLGLAVGCVAAVDIVLMTLVTVIDVAGRYLFNSPLVGADELTVFALAICVFVGLPLVVWRGGLIRVEVLHQILPAGIVRVMDGIANAVSAALLIFFAWRLALKAESLASYGDSTMFLHLKTAPLAYLMAAMCLVSGVLMFALIFAPASARHASPEGEGI